MGKVANCPIETGDVERAQVVQKDLKRFRNSTLNPKPSTLKHKRRKTREGGCRTSEKEEGTKRSNGTEEVEQETPREIDKGSV